MKSQTTATTADKIRLIRARTELDNILNSRVNGGVPPVPWLVQVNLAYQYVLGAIADLPQPKRRKK